MDVFAAIAVLFAGMLVGEALYRCTKYFDERQRKKQDSCGLLMEEANPGEDNRSFLKKRKQAELVAFAKPGINGMKDNWKVFKRMVAELFAEAYIKEETGEPHNG